MLNQQNAQTCSLDQISHFVHIPPGVHE